MLLKGATTVLRKEAEFLGMTFEEVLIFIQRNPYAVPERVLKALTVYRKLGEVK